MVTIPAYFDGNAVRTIDAYPFQKNQRLIITVLDGTATKAESGIAALRGSMAQYANPALIPTEKDAWAAAAGEKHGLR